MNLTSEYISQGSSSDILDSQVYQGSCRCHLLPSGTVSKKTVLSLYKAVLDKDILLQELFCTLGVAANTSVDPRTFWKFTYITS